MKFDPSTRDIEFALNDDTSFGFAAQFPRGQCPGQEYPPESDAAAGSERTISGLCAVVDLEEPGQAVELFK